MLQLLLLSILFSLFLILPLLCQDSFSQIVANNPFYSMSSAGIHSIKGETSDGKILVDLQYSPNLVKKGELTFFKINFFDPNDKDRVRHVDCDFIIRNSKAILFKASEQYGEPSIHSPDGIMLTSFGFNKTGEYKISVEVEGLNFFPIKPLYVDFSTSVTHTSDNSSRIVITT